jgi:succinyl-diaminopimelate desuccinylase
MKDQKYAKDIIQETIKLIQIPSVKDVPKENAPFGEEVAKALNHCLEVCRKLGMKTSNLQNYIGYAEIGEGDKEIGILVHVDVVPVKESDWEYPPFQGVIADEKIFGRGAVDDKGPAIAAIFAMKRLLEELKNLNKRVRIIFCTDEESSWNDIPIYLENERESNFAFSPDAHFPVIQAEKGILQLEVQIKNTKSWLNKWEGGTRANVVPDQSSVFLKPELKDLLGSNEELPELIRNFSGKAAHGSLPEKGENALIKALDFLKGIEKKLDEEAFFSSLYSLFKDIHGAGLGIDWDDEVSGKLTFNLGKVRTENDTLIFSLDIRHPVSVQKNQVLEKIKQYFTQINELNYHLPLYRGMEHPEIQILMSAYEEVMGEKSDPIHIGGGTLARAFHNAVAFGPLFPGEEATPHMSNEYIPIQSLLQAHEIYFRALKKLVTEEW